MAEILVVAPPADHARALALVQALNQAGVSAEAPRLDDHWNKDLWLFIKSWPEDAFIVFCVTQAGVSDAVYTRTLWQVAPMSEDKSGRFIFATFDADALTQDSVAPFLKHHFTANSADSAAIKAHIDAHRTALAEAARSVQKQRAALEADMRRAPNQIDAPPDADPPGVGGGERPKGIGGGGLSIEERLGQSEASLPPSPQPAPANQARPSAHSSAHPSAHPSAHASVRPSARERTQSSERARAPVGAPVGAPAGQPARSAKTGLARASAAKKLDRVDAMALAPKKLRRGTSELVRVALFRPRDKARAVRAAKLADSSARSAGAMQNLGKIERDARVCILLEARGASCEAPRAEALWTGAPLDFNFAVEPSLDEHVAQALFTIRILVDDAQLGAITFVRPLLALSKSSRKVAPNGGEKLRRVERVFLSYSSADRTPVAMIASAYQRAGITCFFDRTTLKSGEEWSPRLLNEIARADLFHLCWSKRAATSPWVERETAYAMTKRRKSGSRRPDITIQMLDGPPWAPHPASLDALNFDDFARAAMVGYARGEGD